MPELPDLQVFAGNIQKSIKGKTVKHVRIHNRRMLKTPAAAFEKALEGRKVAKVYREGKELHIAFDDDTVLGLHLMLHGNLYLFEGENKHKHPIIELLFSDDTGLVLSDWQGKATPTLNPEDKEAPDALSKTVTAGWLKGVLESKRAAIKNMLLDQHVIRGIGNAYADEILWEARISPFAIAGKIPSGKVTALAKAIKEVLKDAENQIKKAHPGKINGEYRDFLKIHNSKKKESPTGAKILTRTAGGRKTYYTEEQAEF